jgi:hypothetical protein
VNVCDILKVSVGAEHLVIGWIEHEGQTYAMAIKNPRDHEAAVQRLMRAAQNTRRCLSGGIPDGHDCLVQSFPGHPMTWDIDR